MTSDTSHQGEQRAHHSYPTGHNDLRHQTTRWTKSTSLLSDRSQRPQTPATKVNKEHITLIRQVTTTSDTSHQGEQRAHHSYPTGHNDLRHQALRWTKSTSLLSDMSHRPQTPDNKVNKEHITLIRQVTTTSDTSHQGEQRAHHSYLTGHNDLRRQPSRGTKSTSLLSDMSQRPQTPAIKVNKEHITLIRQVTTTSDTSHQGEQRAHHSYPTGHNDLRHQPSRGTKSTSLLSDMSQRPQTPAIKGNKEHITLIRQVTTTSDTSHQGEQRAHHSYPTGHNDLRHQPSRWTKSTSLLFDRSQRPQTPTIKGNKEHITLIRHVTTTSDTSHQGEQRAHHSYLTGHNDLRHQPSRWTKSTSLLFDRSQRPQTPAIKGNKEHITLIRQVTTTSDTSHQGEQRAHHSYPTGHNDLRHQPSRGTKSTSLLSDMSQRPQTPAIKGNKEHITLIRQVTTTSDTSHQGEQRAHHSYPTGHNDLRHQPSRWTKSTSLLSDRSQRPQTPAIKGNKEHITLIRHVTTTSDTSHQGEQRAHHSYPTGHNDLRHQPSRWTKSTSLLFDRSQQPQTPAIKVNKEHITLIWQVTTTSDASHQGEQRAHHSYPTCHNDLRHQPSRWTKSTSLLSDRSQRPQTPAIKVNKEHITLIRQVTTTSDTSHQGEQRAHHSYPTGHNDLRHQPSRWTKSTSLLSDRSQRPQTPAIKVNKEHITLIRQVTTTSDTSHQGEQRAHHSYPTGHNDLRHQPSRWTKSTSLLSDRSQRPQTPDNKVNKEHITLIRQVTTTSDTSHQGEQRAHHSYPTGHNDLRHQPSRWTKSTSLLSDRSQRPQTPAIKVNKEHITLIRQVTTTSDTRQQGEQRAHHSYPTGHNDLRHQPSRWTKSTSLLFDRSQRPQTPAIKGNKEHITLIRHVTTTSDTNHQGEQRAHHSYPTGHNDLRHQPSRWTKSTSLLSDRSQRPQTPAIKGNKEHITLIRHITTTSDTNHQGEQRAHHSYPTGHNDLRHQPSRWTKSTSLLFDRSQRPQTPAIKVNKEHITLIWQVTTTSDTSHQGEQRAHHSYPTCHNDLRHQPSRWTKSTSLLSDMSQRPQTPAIKVNKEHITLIRHVTTTSDTSHQGEQRAHHSLRQVTTTSDTSHQGEQRAHHSYPTGHNDLRHQPSRWTKSTSLLSDRSQRPQTPAIKVNKEHITLIRQVTTTSDTSHQGEQRAHHSYPTGHNDLRHQPSRWTKSTSLLSDRSQRPQTPAIKVNKEHITLIRQVTTTSDTRQQGEQRAHHSYPTGHNDLRHQPPRWTKSTSLLSDRSQRPQTPAIKVNKEHITLIRQVTTTSDTSHQGEQRAHHSYLTSHNDLRHQPSRWTKSTSLLSDRSQRPQTPAIKVNKEHITLIRQVTTTSDTSHQGEQRAHHSYPTGHSDLRHQPSRWTKSTSLLSDMSQRPQTPAIKVNKEHITLIRQVTATSDTSHQGEQRAHHSYPTGHNDLRRQPSRWTKSTSLLSDRSQQPQTPAIEVNKEHITLIRQVTTTSDTSHRGEQRAHHSYPTGHNDLRHQPSRWTKSTSLLSDRSQRPQTPAIKVNKEHITLIRQVTTTSDTRQQGEQRAHHSYPTGHNDLRHQPPRWTKSTSLLSDRSQRPQTPAIKVNKEHITLIRQVTTTSDASHQGEQRAHHSYPTCHNDLRHQPSRWTKSTSLLSDRSQRPQTPAIKVNKEHITLIWQVTTTSDASHQGEQRAHHSYPTGHNDLRHQPSRWTKSTSLLSDRSQPKTPAIKEHITLIRQVTTTSDTSHQGEQRAHHSYPTGHNDLRHQPSRWTKSTSLLSDRSQRPKTPAIKVNKEHITLIRQVTTTSDTSHQGEQRVTLIRHITTTSDTSHQGEQRAHHSYPTCHNDLRHQPSRWTKSTSLLSDRSQRPQTPAIKVNKEHITLIWQVTTTSDASHQGEQRAHHSYPHVTTTSDTSHQGEQRAHHSYPTGHNDLRLQPSRWTKSTSLLFDRSQRPQTPAIKVNKEHITLIRHVTTTSDTSHQGEQRAHHSYPTCHNDLRHQPSRWTKSTSLFTTGHNDLRHQPPRWTKSTSLLSDRSQRPQTPAIKVNKEHITLIRQVTTTSDTSHQGEQRAHHSYPTGHNDLRHQPSRWTKSTSLLSDRSQRPQTPAIKVNKEHITLIRQVTTTSDTSHQGEQRAHHSYPTGHSDLRHQP